MTAPAPPKRHRKYKNIIVMKVGQQYGSRVIPVEIATYLEDASRPVMYIEIAGRRFEPVAPAWQVDPTTAQSIAAGIGSTPEQVMSDIMNSSQRFKTGGVVPQQIESEVLEATDKAYTLAAKATLIAAGIGIPSLLVYAIYVGFKVFNQG